jgi:chitinase
MSYIIYPIFLPLFLRVFLFLLVIFRYAQVNAHKQQNPKLKTLLAMGGWTAGSVIYSNMASTASNRKEFIDSAIEWLRRYDFDGLDMDWEYPANRGGKPSDKANFGLLCKVHVD